MVRVAARGGERVRVGLVLLQISGVEKRLCLTSPCARRGPRFVQQTVVPGATFTVRRVNANSGCRRGSSPSGIREAAEAEEAVEAEEVGEVEAAVEAEAEAARRP